MKKYKLFSKNRLGIILLCLAVILFLFFLSKKSYVAYRSFTNQKYEFSFEYPSIFNQYEIVQDQDLDELRAGLGQKSNPDGVRVFITVLPVSKPLESYLFDEYKALLSQLKLAPDISLGGEKVSMATVSTPGHELVEWLVIKREKYFYVITITGENPKDEIRADSLIPIIVSSWKFLPMH